MFSGFFKRPEQEGMAVLLIARMIAHLLFKDEDYHRKWDAGRVIIFSLLVLKRADLPSGMKVAALGTLVGAIHALVTMLTTDVDSSKQHKAHSKRKTH